MKCKDYNCVDGCRKYNDKHDAYLCSSRDKWLEKKCKEKDCGYCPDRPDKPSKVLND